MSENQPTSVVLNHDKTGNDHEFPLPVGSTPEDVAAQWPGWRVAKKADQPTNDLTPITPSPLDAATSNGSK